MQIDDIKITNTTAFMLADPRVLGAAIRVIAQGGADSDEDKIQKLSGLSAFVWKTEGAMVVNLLDDLAV